MHVWLAQDIWLPTAPDPVILLTNSNLPLYQDKG